MGEDHVARSCGRGSLPYSIFLHLAEQHGCPRFPWSSQCDEGTQLSVPGWPTQLSGDLKQGEISVPDLMQGWDQQREARLVLWVISLPWRGRVIRDNQWPVHWQTLGPGTVFAEAVIRLDYRL